MALNELSKENPVGRFLQNYSDSISEEEKQKRILARKERFLKSFGGNRAPVNQPVLPAFNAPTAINVLTETKPISTIAPVTKEQKNNIQLSPSHNIQNRTEQVPTIKVPTLKELPNAQRDSELGKMNVSTKGNIVTYDIGGNTLSYDASKTDPSKITLRNINNRTNSNAPTWDDYHKQQKERYDAYMNSPRGRYFGPTPLATEAPKDNSFGGLFLQGLQNRRARTEAQIANDIAAQENSRAELETQANRNLLLADQNRISEMDVQGQNKLRDIQGQVAQEPPVRENPLKPIVVKEYDELGNVTGERIKMPNAEGTGYVDNMSNQTTFTESQAEIVEKLTKMRDTKDPRLAAAEAKYKAIFGKLPY